MTTDEICIEVLNNLSGYGESVRRRTWQLFQGL
jgi:hypothetical protein